mmetsp:Transcript_2934/g.8519  ORF Transcript_2934/g.8519 Transcript_2934/m.8519 type:complete len:304 (+) Transcript_2934:102-1013(+)
MGQGNSALEPQRSPFDDTEAVPPASVPPVQPAQRRVSLIPTVLTWSHGGRNVYVTGTFNNWAERIPMRNSRNDFTVCLNLPVGTFSYKFIVDNEWRFSPSQPLVQDAQGNVNNCITVLDEEDFMSEHPSGHAGEAHDGGQFGNEMPQGFGQTWSDETIQLAKDPPPLPCQLTRVPLNTRGQVSFPTLAEEYPHPLPCSLFHMCWQQSSAAKPVGSDVVVIASSSRFRSKFVSLVLYKPGGRGQTPRAHLPDPSMSGIPQTVAGAAGSLPGREMGQSIVHACSTTPRPPSLMQIDDDGAAGGYG